MIEPPKSRMRTCIRHASARVCLCIVDKAFATAAIGGRSLIPHHQPLVFADRPRSRSADRPVARYRNAILSP
jgi:hypothetical protein